MLERMSDFFNNRVDGYEEHMLCVIDSANEFYPFTAKLLPMNDGARLLDLGCGTGLELGYYFDLNPSAKVVGIDLAADMLEVMKSKLGKHDITIIQGSYFDVPFGEDAFDAVVSVESLHHFTMDEKIPLYEKVKKSLKSDGYFVLTDYFSLNDDEESEFRREFLRLKAEQGIGDGEFYHFDTPLTVENEIQALGFAGFTKVEILGKWSATYTLKAQ